jgi:hypothetical protein
VYASDSLETILIDLSKRADTVVAWGDAPLDFLLEFLAAWEKRPVCLTSMAYKWCSAIFEVAGRLGLSGLIVSLPPSPSEDERDFVLTLQLKRGIRYGLGLQSQYRCRPQDLTRSHILSEFAEEEFSRVGLECHPVRTNPAFHDIYGPPQDAILRIVTVLPTILEIGFRLTGPGRDGSGLRLDHTSHHERVFEVAFSSDDDEVIADVMSVWITGGDCAPLGSFVRYLAKRVEVDTPFSPRLRRMGIRVVEQTWRSELDVSGLETVRFLNRLKVDADDMVGKDVWARLLAEVICSPAGLENLSPHYWRLLDTLALGTDFSETPGLRSVEVMKSFGEAEDWEMLEVWMVVVWQSLSLSTPTPTMEAVERVTLKLFMQRPSAFPRFETLCEQDSPWNNNMHKLQRICDQTQAGRPPYVSVRPAQHLSVLMPLFSFLQSTSSCSVTYSTPFVGRRLSERA